MIWYQYVASAICILASAKLIPEIIENKNLSNQSAANAKNSFKQAERALTRQGGGKRAKRTKRKNNKKQSKKRTRRNKSKKKRK